MKTKLHLVGLSRRQRREARVRETRARGHHLRWAAQAWYSGRFPRLAPFLSSGGMIHIADMVAFAAPFLLPMRTRAEARLAA
jgi:hypothetical protein